MSAAIVAGPDTGLIDLSRGGALLEVPARLSLGSAVRLKLAQPGRELIVVNGRVAWQKVASIAGGQIYYRVAVAFEQPLDELPGEAQPQDQPQRALTIVPTRDNLTQFPAPAGQSTIGPAEAADTGSRELRKQLEAATGDLACQTAVLESLAAKLKESEQQRATLAQQAGDAARKADALHAALEARERKHAQSLSDQKDRYEALSAELVKAQQAEYDTLLQQAREAEQQRATLAQQAADAAEKADTLRAELEAREQAHAQALSDQKDRYEALSAELIKATNAQQAEYDTLLQQATEAEQQRATLAQLAVDAAEKADTLHAELEAREQAHAQSLSHQKDRYEAHIVELIKATNEQQAEYDTLLQQATEAEQQRATLAQLALDAAEKADTLHAELEAREQAHAQSLSDQKDRYEALIAELVEATNGQQAEYQTLLQQTTEAQSRQFAEEQKAEREQADARYREVEARLKAAEALCADQQDRFRALRNETEKLMRMVDAASASGAEDEHARAAS